MTWQEKQTVKQITKILFLDIVFVTQRKQCTAYERMYKNCNATGVFFPEFTIELQKSLPIYGVRCDP